MIIKCHGIYHTMKICKTPVPDETCVLLVLLISHNKSNFDVHFFHFFSQVEKRVLRYMWREPFVGGLREGEASVTLWTGKSF